MGTAPGSTIKSTIRLRPFFVKLACSPHVYVQPLSTVVTPRVQMQSVGLGSLAILNWPQVWMWVLALQQTTDLWTCVSPSIKPGIFCTLADMQTPTLQLRIKYPKLKSVYFSIKVNISKFLCNLTKLSLLESILVDWCMFCALVSIYNSRKKLPA